MTPEGETVRFDDPVNLYALDGTPVGFASMGPAAVNPEEAEAERLAKLATESELSAGTVAAMRPFFERTMVVGMALSGLDMGEYPNILDRGDPTETEPEGEYLDEQLQLMWCGYKIGLVHGAAAKGLEVKPS